MGVKTLFKGDQYVVVGKLLSEASGPFTVQVTGDKTGTKYFEDIVIEPCLREPKVVEDATILPIIDDINCFQPIPGEKKSKAQEFLQSLHAFLNIQQLLKKDKKTEALALTLENHFVTPVTSLVVVRPDEEDTLANVDEPIADYDYPTLYAASYAAPAAAAYHPQIFKSASPQAYTPHSRIVSGPRQPPVLTPQSIMAYDDTGFESFSYSTFDYGVYADDYDYPTSRGGPSPISTTRGPTPAHTSMTTSTSTTSSSSTTTKPETCQLTLFSKTYNRGEEWILQDDSADLGSFSDIAISATLEGSCCWQLFGEVNFAGPTTWLRPGGVYRGTDSFGRQLFQDVSSVKRVQC